MLYLLFALFFSTCIFVTFKYFNRFRIGLLPAITMNYVIASAFGYLSCRETGTMVSMLQQPWMLMAILAGLTFILTFVVFALSTQKVGVAMTVVSGKMSIVLSVAVGFLLLAKPFNLIKMLGIAAALLAFYLSNYGREKVQSSRKYLFLPVLLFLSTGANDILMKLSGVYYPHRDAMQFLAATFFTSFIIGVLLTVYKMLRSSLKISWKDILAGTLLGFLNWYSTYFFIKGLFVLPISLFIPVFNAALVFIAAVSGYFFFNEKLSRINRVGVLLAVLAIVVIAFS